MAIAWRDMLIGAGIVAGYVLVSGVDQRVTAPEPPARHPVVLATRTANDPATPPLSRCQLIGPHYFATRADNQPWRVKCVAADLTNRRK